MSLLTSLDESIQVNMDMKDLDIYDIYIRLIEFARTGNLECYEHLYLLCKKNNIKLDNIMPSIMEAAITNGQIKILEYLRKHTYCHSLTGLSGAIYYGHLNIVKFLVERMCHQVNESDIDMAREHGRASILVYLKNKI